MFIMCAMTKIQTEYITPDSKSSFIILGEELDGPRVATIFVICVRRMSLSRSLNVAVYSPLNHTVLKGRGLAPFLQGF